jgi:membrane-bound lytic murein transglycosylase A
MSPSSIQNRQRPHYTRGTRAMARAMAALALLLTAACHGPAPAPACPCPAPSATPDKPAATPPAARFERAAWADLPGWQADAVHEAWAPFLASCARNKRPEWTAVCAQAQALGAQPAPAAVRAFFERSLEPYRAEQDESGRRSTTGLMTGYYEPMLRGSRTATARHTVPLYAAPDDLLTVDLGELYPELKGQRVRARVEGKKVVPYHSRAELDGKPGVAGKAIVFVEDAVDAFFLQVQGSGRVQLPGGETIRLAYTDQNGHPYRSIGRYLVDKGELKLENASAQGIREWIRTHPERRDEVLNANPSVVFFREEKLADPRVGPKGSQGVPLTPGRSVAVDPRFLALGTPLFLATTQPLSEAPLERLVLAQDTGGAIRGPLRVDYFWGWGEEATEAAGRTRQTVRVWVLWPKGSVPGVANQASG